MNYLSNKIKNKSREIFHDLHKKQANNNYIFTRLADLLTTKFLGVDDDFFHGKVCLDAGCGSNANASYSMLNMGADYVYPMDLDKSINKTSERVLGDFYGRYATTVGDVMKIPFEDNFFDFTHCAGVLHHTESVENGIKELIRVTKPGGMIYIETYGKGGIVRDMVSFFRERYQNSSEFHYLIDNLSHKDIQSFINWIFLTMHKNGDNYINKISKSEIKILFDEDLVLTIKDRIMAPVYHENSESEIRQWLSVGGCNKIYRLTRYPKMKNIRRFLLPLYSEYNSKYARLLYGDGNLCMRSIKK
jgi:ubiquinone/menaquinone biosynthesis C-methylase UbiE